MNAATRRALLIGIDRYPNYPSDLQLRGCVNDARVLAALLLERFAFPSNQIRLLLNAQATREAILAAFEELIAASGPEDSVLIHYSGHGAQVADAEGEEADRQDETIVPSDSAPSPGPACEISDDELNLLLRRLAAVTPSVLLILDCCHAGTGFRDADPNAPRVREIPRSRSALTQPLAPFSPRSGKAQPGPSGWLPPSERHLLLAACRAEQLSYEYTAFVGEDDVVHHGTLSYFLIQALRAARPGATYRELFEQVSLQVHAARPGQSPQLEGQADQTLFGADAIPPQPYLLVRAREGATLTLGAGAALGLRPGSKWALFPAGAHSTSNATERLGLAVVTQVGATSAQAEIREEPIVGAIVVGARAFAASHNYDDMRLAVALSAPSGGDERAIATLGEQIEASPLLRLAVGQAAGSSLQVVLLPVRAAPGPDDLAPELGQLARPTWLVLRDGVLCMPPHAADEPAATAMIVENLARAARYRNALALRNADPASALAQALRLTLKQRDPSGNWQAALPAQAGGLPIFRDGERIALEITSLHDAPLYIVLLNFDASGGIGQLYPPPFAQEALAPGHTLSIGANPPLDGEIQLYLDPAVPTSPAGAYEVYKLIATTQPADFSPLFQAGYRALPAATPLTRLLNAALVDGTRGVTLHSGEGEDWTTVERPFRIIA